MPGLNRIVIILAGIFAGRVVLMVLLGLFKRRRVWRNRTAARNAGRRSAACPLESAS